MTHRRKFRDLEINKREFRTGMTHKHKFSDLKVKKRRVQIGHPFVLQGTNASLLDKIQQSSSDCKACKDPSGKHLSNA